MTEELNMPDTRDRASLYAALLPQVRELLRGEKDAIAAMANLAAALKETTDWHWVGFYRVVGNELVLGPFQGPIACARIAHGKGVCGTAWAEARAIVVPDVDKFPGHIACSALSRSEVVVPLKGKSGQIAAVLDIDSTMLDEFSDVDVAPLQNLCALIEPLLA